VIRAVAYASCYVYSPTGTGAVCERSRLLRTLLKAGDAGFMLKYALRVHQQATDSPLLAGFFGTTDVLVRIPAREKSDGGRVMRTAVRSVPAVGVTR
jgi:selenocysteine lyase/cysteine desulfurase